MTFRRVALLAVVALLAAPGAALAQADDDFLVPLTPDSGPPKSKSKSKPRPKRRPPAKKKPTARKAPAPQQDLLDDGLKLAPLVQKTELLVKLGGGLKGATLYVDNKEVGPLPGPAQTLTPGEHTVVVRRPGFAEFSQRVNVAEGRITEVVASLDPVAAVVAVTADVPHVSILVDGQPSGSAPLTGLVLKPGSHDFEARREGFDAEPKRIALRAGRDYTVEFFMRPKGGTAVAGVDRPTATPLTPTASDTQPDDAAVALGTQPQPDEQLQEGSPSIFKRWYFWAGVGVVAAAAGTTVALTRGDPLSKEDVCGAGCDGVLNPPEGWGFVRF